MEFNHQTSQKRKFSLRSYLGCYMANVRPQQSHDDDELKPISPSPTMWSSEVSDHRLIVLNLRVFTMSELKAATRNFSKSKIIGEGGFGPVYKGYVSNETKAEPVAVKLLNLNGHQGHKEWLAEVMYLGKLKHPNLVKLIGYCCEDEQRLLVYEYMVKGSLENHLFKGLLTTLPWRTRMKIAIGTAKGLAFLHESERPVIYRDLKTSNILLDSEYRAKLSDLGLARDGPVGDEKHVSTRVMGTQGYTAPEYILTGHLSTKSDVYSFGVVMLELLSGRRAIDETHASKEQRLVEWARPYLTDARKLHRIMDPSLDGQYSAMGARKAAEVAYRCLSRCPDRRPAMTAVVDALERLSELDDVPQWPLVYVASPSYVGVRDIYNT